MPGPTPKRTAERRRRNKVQVDTTVMSGPVEMPEPSEEWHPVAVAWFRSLGESGQAQWFEPSDWAAAVYVAEAMSLNLKAGRFSAELFKAVWSAMGELLTTEGARRRVRLEIERGAEEPREVTDLDDFKRRLSEGG